jgi:hypothetical protein
MKETGTMKAQTRRGERDTTKVQNNTPAISRVFGE